jgi:formylglycine-generating enzyme required for sulfatase activity
MFRQLAATLLVIGLILTAGRTAVAPTSSAWPHPPSWTDRTTGMEFVLVRPQVFQMGTPASEPGRESQEALHVVELTRPYYLARHEVTQAQWERVMGNNPSHFAGCARCPVERVNFHDVEAFIAKLRELTHEPYRLPTEAEWELGCRAGGSLPFGDRTSLSSRDANIDGNFPYNAPQGTARERTTTVGWFAANAWGLYDMSGNVWEWVQDWHCPYPTGRATDPVGACDSPYRVIRGGSWKFDGNSARCGVRYTHRPQDLGYSLGFRLARDVQ